MKKFFISLFLFIIAVSAQQGNNDILLGKYYKIKSEKIGEDREFFISVPQSYENTQKSYPVIFMMDGENNFSAGIIGGIRYLEMLGEIPELIIVGVKNTDRTRDVFPMKLKFRSGATGGGGADNFLAFFRDELQPFITENYRINDYRIFYGTSNSGYTAVYEMFKNPDSYSAYIASSPTLIRPFMEQSDSLIQNWKGGEKYLNIIVGENDFVTLPQTNTEFKTKIDRFKPKGLKLKFNILEGEGHVPLNSLIVGLKDLFKGWKFNEELNEGNYQAYINHFNSLSYKFNFDIAPPERTLNSFAYDILRQSDKIDFAIEVFSYIVEKYPSSSNAFDSLGEAYMKKGDVKLAITNYEKSLELDPDNNNAKEKLKELKSKKTS